MSKLYYFVSSLVIAFLFISWQSPSPTIISGGHQPQISMNNAGIIRVVSGSNDSIFCTTSSDKGATFSKRVLVGMVKQMHLGMARGPQLASSAHYSIITAMDKAGDIHFFVLDHKKWIWQNKGFVNDIRSSAPEGLMNIAADKEDNFYATWLDLRQNKMNNIYFSSLPSGHIQWVKNTLAYRSPEGHVCECCRPSIAVSGQKVAIMFRNWLLGSRDLYMVRSANKGLAFSNAVKMGSGTWKLNACPMDGGGLNFNVNDTINTTWQRQGVVYYCKPGESEKELGMGRDCGISSASNKTIVAMGNNGTVSFRDVAGNSETVVGKGTYLKTMILPGNKILCVWEDGNEIKSRLI